MSFCQQCLSEPIKSHISTNIKLEDSLNRFPFIGKQFNRLIPILLIIDVAKGCRCGKPPLLRAFVHTLQHFVTQVLTVVLRHCRHHVERQLTRRALPKLVIDEQRANAELVFHFLQPHRIAQIAASPVQLMGDNPAQVFFLRVLAHPGKHLLEFSASSIPLGGLRHGEFFDYVPSFTVGLFTNSAYLRVQRIAFLLFTRRHTSPCHDVHNVPSHLDT